MLHVSIIIGQKKQETNKIIKPRNILTLDLTRKRNKKLRDEGF